MIELIEPSTAAELTVLSVDTGIKSVVRYDACSEAVIEYIYLRVYPPRTKVEVDSDVGSAPLYAVPLLLSKTLYTRLSEVLKKNVESNIFVAPDVVAFDELILSSYIS